jgi:predicted nucleotidyltransferase
MQAIRNPMDAAKFAASVIRRHLPDPAYRVFLFGSRATGSAGERSDIDIGIEGPASVSRAALAAIHDEIEQAPTLFTIDVVDFARVSERSQNIGFRRTGRGGDHARMAPARDSTGAEKSRISVAYEKTCIRNLHQKGQFDQGCLGRSRLRQ